MMLLVNSVALLYTLAQYYLFSLIPLFEGSFTRQSLQTLGTMCVIFVTFFCLIINLLYAYKHWQQDQMKYRP